MTDRRGLGGTMELRKDLSHALKLLFWFLSQTIVSEGITCLDLL